MKGACELRAERGAVSAVQDLVTSGVVEKPVISAHSWNQKYSCARRMAAATSSAL